MWGAVQRYYGNISQKLYDNADLRTRDMPLMQRLDVVILLTVAYLGVAVFGPRLMANRRAMDLKRTMFIYNVAITLLNLWMFLEMLTQSWKSGYTYTCDPYRLSYKPADIRIANVLWWYFISKAIDFLDTIFMVLKKNNRQISVLHVWHHSFMFPCHYFVVLLCPCGQALFGPLINSFIHVLMYSYYALSLFPALQPYLWWKKYLTQMQLGQFFILVANSAYGTWTGCDFPHFLAYIQHVFLGSLMVLFGNFYIQSYVKRKQGRPTRPARPVQPKPGMSYADAVKGKDL